jgi:hypothetical protein
MSAAKQRKPGEQIKRYGEDRWPSHPEALLLATLSSPQRLHAQAACQKSMIDQQSHAGHSEFN